MKTRLLFATLGAAGVLLATFVLTRVVYSRAQAAPTAVPAAADAAARGRYVVLTGGCNDCHTPRFMELGMKVPEDEWLTGVPVGWRGPWGTTYASNLRRHVAAFDNPETWMNMVRARQGMPPMPWPNLHAMTDEDLRAVFSYIRSLPVKGDIMPPPVPPDAEPSTPFIRLEPVLPK